MRKKKRGGSPGATLAEKRRCVQALRDSGLTGRAFCAREGIATSTLYRWRRQVKEGDCPPAGHTVGAVTPPSFAEVRVLPEGAGVEAKSPSPSACRVAIHLSSGDRLFLPEACDPRWVGQVVRALRSGSC